MTRDPGYPCKLCGVNTWTACRHRPAGERPTEAPAPPDRKGIPGGGRYAAKRHQRKVEVK